MLVPTSGGSDRHSTEDQISDLKENGERNEVLSRNSPLRKETSPGMSQAGSLSVYRDSDRLCLLGKDLVSYTPAVLLNRGWSLSFQPLLLKVHLVIPGDTSVG